MFGSTPPEGKRAEADANEQRIKDEKKIREDLHKTIAQMYDRADKAPPPHDALFRPRVENMYDYEDSKLAIKVAKFYKGDASEPGLEAKLRDATPEITDDLIRKIEDKVKVLDKELRNAYTNVIKNNPINDTKLQGAFDDLKNALDEAKTTNKAFVEEEQKKLEDLRKNGFYAELKDLQSSLNKQKEVLLSDSTRKASLEASYAKAMELEYTSSSDLWVSRTDVDVEDLKLAAAGVGTSVAAIRPLSSQEETDRFKRRLEKIKGAKTGYFSIEPDGNFSLPPHGFTIFLQNGIAFPEDYQHPGWRLWKDGRLKNPFKSDWEKFDYAYNKCIDFQMKRNGSNIVNFSYKNPGDFNVKEFNRFLDLLENRNKANLDPSGHVRTGALPGKQAKYQDPDPSLYRVFSDTSRVSKKERNEILARIKKINTQAAMIEMELEKRAKAASIGGMSSSDVSHQTKVKILDKHISELKASEVKLRAPGSPAYDIHSALGQPPGTPLEFKTGSAEIKAMQNEVKSLEDRMTKLKIAFDEIAQYNANYKSIDAAVTAYNADLDAYNKEAAAARAAGETPYPPPPVPHEVELKNKLDLLMTHAQAELTDITERHAVLAGARELDVSKEKYEEYKLREKFREIVREDKDKAPPFTIDLPTIPSYLPKELYPDLHAEHKAIKDARDVALAADDKPVVHTPLAPQTPSEAIKENALRERLRVMESEDIRAIEAAKKAGVALPVIPEMKTLDGVGHAVSTREIKQLQDAMTARRAPATPGAPPIEKLSRLKSLPSDLVNDQRLALIKMEKGVLELERERKAEMDNRNRAPGTAAVAPVRHSLR